VVEMAVLTAPTTTLERTAMMGSGGVADDSLRALAQHAQGLGA